MSAAVIMDPGDLSVPLALRLAFTLALLHCTAASPLPEDDSEVDVVSFTRADLFLLEPTNFTTKNETSGDGVPAADTMPILWYLISFGGLITFFLLLSFSEFCCRKAAAAAAALPRKTAPVEADATPPPPYHLFAPPNYDSLFRHDAKPRPSVYLVPVHTSADARTDHVDAEDIGCVHAYTEDVGAVDPCTSSNDTCTERGRFDVTCTGAGSGGLEFGELMRRNPMGDGEVVTPPPPP